MFERHDEIIDRVIARLRRPVSIDPGIDARVSRRLVTQCRPARVGRPLRVLVTNWLDLANPSSGGAEIHFHAVFERLAARGHRITAVTSGWGGCSKHEVMNGMHV